ncbi:MAG: putative ABC transporter permease [[Clostridium] leptum]
MKKRLKNDIAIFTIGGLSYALIEILWRGYTHWTMIITGGICFVVLFRVFSRITHAKLWQKCAAGAAIITAIEFAAGCIVNLWLQMDVWDYSFLPLNLFGQVCLLYTFFMGSSVHSGGLFGSSDGKTLSLVSSGRIHTKRVRRL